jgi:hypothetical protein
MVTNKTFTIRLGLTRPWSSQISASNWYQYHLSIRLKHFFDKFFGDKFYQNRGISFSHVLIKGGPNALNLEVFLHDSKLYDFFNTKPSRRAISIIRKKAMSKKFFRRFRKAVKKYKKFSKKFLFNTRLLKKSFQSKFKVSRPLSFSFRKSLFLGNRPKIKKIIARLSPTQTLEKKFRSSQFFRFKFRNVRKFVKASRRISLRFKKSKFRFFKPVKPKKSKFRFKLAKLNYFLNKRRIFSNLFLFKKGFRKFRKFKKPFKPFFKKRNYNGHTFRRFGYPNKFFKPKKPRRFIRLRFLNRYKKARFKIFKRFRVSFYRRISRIRDKFSNFYKLNSSKRSKVPSYFSNSQFFLRKKIIKNSFFKTRQIFKKEFDKKMFNLKLLNKSKLARKLAYALNKKKVFRQKKRTFSRKKRFKFTSRKKRLIRYPFWRIRFSPLRESTKRASKFIFFNPQSAHSSRRFIRYSFYNFLGKILSFQIFKNFKIPVVIKFNLFPLHRASTDFYLNFITTKLYYRYILSDVIKPIVRLSLKFYRGFVIHCRGRFTRAQIAVSKKFIKKSVSYSKISTSLDYGQKDVVLKYGTCNLKIWIRK